MALPASLSNIPANMVDGDDAGDATPGSTNVGLLAGRLNTLATSVNALEQIAAMSFSGIRNVTMPPYNAAPADFYTDGDATISSTTFTSATANFTGADVGKQIMILRAGPSFQQDHHTTIASVTNATTVVLTHAPNRSQDPARFYVFRVGDQTAALQAAIDAAAAAGGWVYLPPGAYAHTGLVLKNRVGLLGAGRRASMLYLLQGNSGPSIRNDLTTDNNAQFTTVQNLWVEGAAQRQTDVSTTTTTAYTAGVSTSITLTDASNVLYSGSGIIGTNRIYWASKSGNTLNGVQGGTEGTTDANASIGATFTHHRGVGIYFACDPNNSPPANAEAYDPFHVVEGCIVKAARGDGIQVWGQSDVRINNTRVEYCYQGGIRPSWDTWVNDCTVLDTGRWGYFVRGSETRLVNCKAFGAGSITGAEGWGFLVEGPVSLEEGIKILSACNAQDCRAEGFYFRRAQRVLASITSSSNSTSGVGTYAGVKIDGCTNGIIDVISTERRFDGVNSYQQNALHILNTDVVTTNMKIRCTHAASVGATVGSAIKSGSTLTAGNDIQINSQGGYANPAFSTPYVPDPYVAETHQMTLTGNLAISAPANAHLGTRLRFVLVQDATGGRTMTFDSSLPAQWGPSLAPSATNVIEFIYNGTAWIQVTPDPAAPISKRTLADVSDSTSSNTTTLTDLDFAVAANTDYSFVYYIAFTSSATATGLSLAVSAPTSPTTFAYGVTIGGLAADGTAAAFHGAGTASDDQVTSTAVVAAGTVYIARVEGILRTGANAGTLSIKFAPETNASVTVRRGSQGILYVS